MSRKDQHWERLTARARRSPADPAPAAPFGFATRVVGLAHASPLSYNPWSVFERFALRGLVAAAVCGSAAVAFSFSELMPDGSEDVPVEMLAFNPVVDVS
jgi:hypothetical protein